MYYVIGKISIILLTDRIYKDVFLVIDADLNNYLAFLIREVEKIVDHISDNVIIINDNCAVVLVLVNPLLDLCNEAMNRIFLFDFNNHSFFIGEVHFD